ncbi:hypothetical protein EOD41_06815 [Mucilaginibacter limnophilus]|uniref:Uncharacterized protein n=1 Tax=Mucilaginibacter limnophilus TaxID=1932778 RepID=A0A437MVL3_9SPHI|nr:hypothetical protein [Mucilaginibacter limnophilus]RVU01666.1 hypothetical protein EOD41_06815 [Mucilaginibacter limnophilus]
MAAYVVYPSKEQEKVIQAFFDALGISFQKQEDDILPQHVFEGILKGQEDIKEGRTVSLEDFKKGLLSAK